MKKIYGILLNEHTGCIHYHQPYDIVAIQFKCCRRYYACFLCHLALESHAANRWSANEFHRKAILCGKCNTEMTIHEYLTCNYRCLHCRSEFNPKCRRHWNLYFEKKPHD